MSVKAVTLIFISGRGSAISSAQKGKSGSIYWLSCFSHAKKRDFHENPDHIYTELTFINPLSVYCKKKNVYLCRLLKYLKTLPYTV